MSKVIPKKDNTRFILIVCASIVCVLLLSIIYLLVHFNVFTKPETETDKGEYADNIFYMNYDVSRLDNSEESQDIKYGHELFINTPKYLGPCEAIQWIISGSIFLRSSSSMIIRQ